MGDRPHPQRRQPRRGTGATQRNRTTARERLSTGQRRHSHGSGWVSGIHGSEYSSRPAGVVGCGWTDPADCLIEHRKSVAGAQHRTQQEIAVRVALGASRRDLVQQLLAEALLLALAGGALGLLLSKWGTLFLLKLSPVSLPLTESPALDAQVLTFALAISLLTGIFFGLLPALQSSNPDLRSALGAGGR